VDDKTTAITAVETLFPHVGLAGRMLTLDALLPQRHGAPTMVDKGGDSGLLVTETQPQLRAAIALGWTLPPGGARPAPARTVAVGHGRSEQRHSTTREARVGDSAWPGLAQVFALGRHGRAQKTGQERVAVV
jgi:hypothetical protein